VVEFSYKIQKQVGDTVDKVNPSHYKNGKIECIDAIESATHYLTGFDGYCVGNIIKYVWRYDTKNGLEDLYKARWYLEKLIKEHEELKNEIHSS
jgi:hypothetical protein